MDFLLESSGDKEGVDRWESLFDIIVVGACKPAYLSKNALPLLRVARDGAMSNIEDETCDDESKESKDNLDFGLRNVFQGGSWSDLHRMLNITKAETVMYVGDHMYSDILRSRRTLGWRTCLIVPELETEIRICRHHLQLYVQLNNLRSLQKDLDEYLDLLRQDRAREKEFNFVDSNAANVFDAAIKRAEDKVSAVKKEVFDVYSKYDVEFNPIWGQIFKAGHQDSRFAKQVTDFACIYTSRASNIGLTAPGTPFRPNQELRQLEDRTILRKSF